MGCFVWLGFRLVWLFDFDFIFLFVIFRVLVLRLLLGLSAVLASGPPIGTDDDDNDVVLSFLKTPPGRSRVASLTISLSAEAIRKWFDG